MMLYNFIVEVLASNILVKVITFLSFGLFLIAIYLFIHQTYEEKKILDEKIKEKTKELEEAKKVLEIRVRARTRQLEEERSNLEKRVIEKTEELQKKINELEKFRKLAVGRELKMIELKKKIKELENKLKNIKEKNV